jgi:energy-coupling factor transporter ATP-binding protein EcfA2
MGNGFPNYRPNGPPLTGTRFNGMPMRAKDDPTLLARSTVDNETYRMASLSQDAPRIPWEVFITEHFGWRSGEHVGLIGPTGQGKTTMLLSLLPLHPYVVVFVTKPVDQTMSGLEAQGYHKMERWQSISVDHYPKRLLWPDASRINSQANQARVFNDALERIYRERGWTVAIDELWYFMGVLSKQVRGIDFGQSIRVYLQQARSLGISLLVGSQRPSRIPVEVYDQSTHLFFWRDNDRTNLDRISGIAYRSSGLIRGIVSNLDTHQVLYVNTRTGFMCRTRCPDVQIGGEV